MLYTPLTKKALRISFEAHKNRVDKGGLPYVYHPFRVAEQVTGEEETCVALLHDVAEDSEITVDDIAGAGFPPEVTDALRLLVHDPATPYMEYIKKIRKNPIARHVKLADLSHNSDAGRLGKIDKTAEERLKKYSEAREFLLSCEKQAYPER